MRKRLLFVMNNLNCGGAEKALISLLETIDYSKYEVDLYLFKHEGIFISQIPLNVNLLPQPNDYKYFDMSLKIAIVELVKKWDLKLALSRLLAGWIFKTENSRTVSEQRAWKHLSSAFKKIDNEYDVAIGYLEKNPVYFCIDNVNAKKKIGWIHNDYEKLGMNKDIDTKYFSKLDYVFTVSQECLNVLKRVFPQYRGKFKLMHNIVSAAAIKKLSLDEVTDIEFSKEDINIVSVGRLNSQKGFEIAIESCSILVKNGHKIKWIVLGEGEEREKLENIINKYNVNDNFKLIGIRENPYPYIRKSDFYVQSSRFEGKSIAIDEAKILEKPIVVTNFSTAKDQIENCVNGLISNMDSKSLANEIERLILDIDFKNSLVSSLSKENLGNEYEIDKLYNVF